MAVSVPNLAGVRAKIDRAKKHFEELNVCVTAWGTSEENDHAGILYPHPDRKRVDFKARKVKANDIAWPLIIGDVVHNLRSALDHLVCQLALLEDITFDCKKTAFPIYDKEGAFRDFSNDKVKPFVCSDAFAMIEDLQPYKAAKLTGRDPKTSNLRIISELDIIDKHRMLVVAAKYLRVSSFVCTFNKETPLPVTFSSEWQPLKNGAVLASIDISGITFTREDELHMKTQTETQILFNETGVGCDGLPVEDALRPCIECVSQVVDIFEARFFAA